MSQGWSKPLYKVRKENIESLYSQPTARRIKTHKVGAMNPISSKQKENKTVEKNENFRIMGMLLEKHFWRKFQSYWGS